MDLDSFFSSNQQLATSNSPLAIAVSGGADSLALLLLAQEWANAHGGKIVALTVDHGMRKESHQEAVQVKAWCDARSIEQHILTWGAPQKASQAQARDARYELLTGWCKKNNVKYLLTAHHRGDQAETLFFRLARGSNLRGLACIAPVAELDGISLMRPLLDVSKKELMDYLQARGQPWIEDPSNQDPHYTRNALRASLQTLFNAEDIESRAAKIAKAFGRIRTVLDRKTDEAFAQVVQMNSNGAKIDATLFAALAPETAQLLLARLICELTGDDHPPRTEKLSRLCRWLVSPDAAHTELAHLTFVQNPQKAAFIVSRQPLTS